MFRSTNATAASNNPSAFINDNINNKKINKSNDGNKNTAPSNPRRSFLFSDTRSSLRISNSKKLSLATNNLSTLNSNGGGIANNSTSAATLTRDPRPLRDKNFQQIIQQEIYDYLLDEDFIIQTNYPISIKSLKQPTQRDFVTIFKWLYVRLDPGYTFKKSLESDVYSIIKTIQYPFLETINKSQISAVGGTNWPKFLGMIHWLVNVNKSLDKTLVFLDKSLVSENTQDFTILNQTFKTIDEQEERQEKYELMVERLFIDYILKSYKYFLELHDDFSKFFQELELGFDKFVHIIQTDINNIDNNNQDLKSQYSNLINKCKSLELSQEKNRLLFSDLQKLTNYVDLMKQKSGEWQRKLDKIQLDINKKSTIVTDLISGNRELQKKLDQRGFDIESVNDKIELQTKIASDRDGVASNIEKLRNSNKSLDFDLKKIYQSLLDLSMQYQSTIESLSVLRDVDISKIKFNLPKDLISNDKRRSTFFLHIETSPIKIQKELLYINAQINENIQNIQLSNAKVENSISYLQQEIKNKSELIEQLENRCSETKIADETDKQKLQTLILQQEIEIEKLESRISLMNQSANDYLKETENKMKQVSTKLDSYKEYVGAERGKLISKVNQIVEFVTSFTKNIDGSLNNLQKEIDSKLSDV